MDHDRPIPVPVLIYPALIALWSTAFSVYSAVDGLGMYASFGLDVACDPFPLGNSAARYAGIAAALWLGIALRNTPQALLVAMVARFVMDVGDTIAGLQVGLLGVADLWQPFVMFLGPELAVLGWLLRELRR